MVPAGFPPSLSTSKADVPSPRPAGLRSTLLSTAGGCTPPPEVRTHGQVSSPAGPGRADQALPPGRSLGSPRPWSRLPVRLASAGPGSPGGLEEGRRAPAKCSAGAASLQRPSCTGSCAHLSPFYRREEDVRARLPPSCRRLQNFPPPAHQESKRLSGAGRALSPPPRPP